MTTQRIRLALFILPALVVFAFETLRHNFCIPYVSLNTGNWIIALLTALLISVISNGLFVRFEHTERALSAERETRALLEERERLARELHDRIAQSLFYAGVQIRANQKSEANLPPELADDLDQLHVTLREIDDNVRQVIFNLRQDIASGGEFSDRIKLFLENALTNQDITSEVSMSDDSSSILQPSEEIQLFGILQEALTNVLKHAQATHITITLGSGPTPDRHRWCFEITDNGVGFDVTTPRDKKYGLDIVNSRAHDIGAQLDIHSDPSGTTLRIVKLAVHA